MMSMFPDNESSTAGTADSESGARASSPKLLSQELFRNSSTVCIEHQGEHYWLRLTRGNKLILTK
jgi:hemin uptake protein HemP